MDKTSVPNTIAGVIQFVHQNIKGKDKVVDDDLVMLGQSLSEKFGVKVVVENSWNGGRISFHYSNLEELDFILTRLN